MDRSRFVLAVKLIDQANAGDPVWESWQDQPWPRTYTLRS